LVKSVTRHVVAGRPSHMAGQPWSLASTDLQLGIPLYHLLESVPVKANMRGCKVQPTGMGVWPAGHPLGPLVSGLCTLPSRVKYTPG
jgi:hypothetical protein